MDDPYEMIVFAQEYRDLGWAIQEQLDDLVAGETNLDKFAPAALSQHIIPFCNRWFDGEYVNVAQRILARFESEDDLDWRRQGTGLYDAVVPGGRYLIGDDDSCDGRGRRVWLAQWRADMPGGDVSIVDIGYYETLREAKAGCLADWVDEAPFRSDAK